MSSQTRPLLVIGHKNPDTDSVCSAIAYAHLKAELIGEPAIPCRAGNLNLQTSFVLSHFGVESPRLVTDVYPKVSDIMVKGADLLALEDTEPLGTAHRILTERRFSFLPVQDHAGHAAGRITALRLAGLVDDLQKLDGETQISARLADLATAVAGAVLSGEIDGPDLKGTVEIQGIGRARSAGPGAPAIALSPAEPAALRRALKRGPRALISCGVPPPPEGIVEAARRSGCAVVSSPLSPLSVLVRILLLQPLGRFVETGQPVFRERDLVRSVQREMSKSNEGGFVVVDDELAIRGVVTRINLLDRSRFRLVLVDHNELAQAVDGAEEADIVEIIDHHRIGARTTDAPITFINRVVGSTATIVAELYRTHGFSPEPHVAGILLSAMLSDTLVLRSPTTTAADRAGAEWLSGLAGVEAAGFGEEMFAAGSALEGAAPEAVLEQDRKRYQESGVSFSVSQVEMVGFGPFAALKERLAKALDELTQREILDFACLMVTDITRETSMLLCSGKGRFIDAVSYPRVEPGLFEMKGVLSRKKQMLPYLLDLIRSIVA